MIHKIYASDARFKAVQFEPGLNIILADRTEESSKKDSRNGLGKTTLIHILDFCLGANLNKKILPIDEIKNWTFFVEIDLRGEKFTASRSITNSKIIKIKGNVSVLPITAETNNDENYYFYKEEDWKKILGSCFFGLSTTDEEKYSPTFRALISYFMRKGWDAYNQPFNFLKTQPAWSIQVHNAFFLGLNWHHAVTAQQIKDKSKAITALNDAIKTGIVSSEGELEAERVRLTIEFDKEKKSLSEFKVHPQYKQIQEDANFFTQAIHELLNNNLILRRKLDQYIESIKTEAVPDMSAVSQLYEEAGLHFGELLKKTLLEARTFHSKIVQNRKHFLKAEIEQIKNQISNNEKNIEADTNKRADLMAVLHTHGALEEFTVLQERLLERKAYLEKIKLKITDMKEMSIRKKEIKSERIQLETKLRRDYEQSRQKWEQAIVGFNENSQALYQEAGALIIDVSENGYSFNVEIARSNSEGVSKMKIFCYDLVLVNIFSRQNKINFLVHDSTMFDSVDSRQIAHALEHAHKKALESNFQYICFFNSDKLPKTDFTQEFNINDFTRLTLGDKAPEDSLLGFRFE